jgi:hypothetical protein
MGTFTTLWLAALACHLAAARPDVADVAERIVVTAADKSHYDAVNYFVDGVVAQDR